MARDPATGRRTRWRRRLGVFVITLVTIVGMAEVACRLLLPQRDSGKTRAGFVEPDPDLLWRLTPRSEPPLVTNELGIRDAPYDASADRKVLLLGDSVAWGDSIPTYRHCFPWLLEQLLAASDPEHTYEVVNASVPGYSTFQELGWLRIHGLALEPDLIVLQFCLNDVVGRYTEVAGFGGDDYFLGIDTRKGIRGLNGWLIRNSRAYEALVRWLQRRARNFTEYEVKKLASDELGPELEGAWRDTLADISEMQQVASEAGIPLLLAIVPYAFQLQDPRGLRQPQERLIEHARKLGIPWVDLLPPLAALQEAPVLFFDPSHLGPVGHQAVAELLFPHVEALLPR